MVDLVGSADLLDPPLVEHGDAVTEAHRLDLVMGDVDGGDPHPLLELLQLVTGRRAELGVQVGQRLVEQEHLRLPDQGAGQRDPLALAAGQLPGPAVEQLVNAEPAGCPAHLLRPLLPRYARGREREGDVREHGLVRVQGVALEHHRDLPRPGGQVGDHPPPDEDVAVAGVFQARDEPQQGCLAAAGRAEQDEVLALAGRQVDAVHGGDGPELLAQLPGFHDGHGSPSARVVAVHTRPLARHLLKMASHCFAADCTACFGVAFPRAALAIIVGRTLVSKISPSAAFAAPGNPTFVVHFSASASSASLFAGFDLKGSFWSQPGNAAATPVPRNAGKSYSSELYTEPCAAPTRSIRNCLILSTFAAHLGTR